MGTKEKAEITASPHEQGIHVVAKPAGPQCNLNCEYCFYKDKTSLFAPADTYRMSPDILSRFIREYVTCQPTPFVEFVWQGGEPTLAGLDFFDTVVELQKPFRRTKHISNSLQTNGTLLDKGWCDFLKKNNFLVGISLDGPKDIHDRYRKDLRGNGTFERTYRGLKLLQQFGIEYNVMAAVARDTAMQPREVYQFFKDEEVEFVQFTPIIERTLDSGTPAHNLRLCGPADLTGESTGTITPWTVEPEQYGDFLIAIYQDWVHHDVGRIFVMNFEWALNAWIGNPSPVCVHAEECGRTLVIEHNGDVFACDHCVYPQYKLGNIASDGFLSMTMRSARSGFGSAKKSRLPRWCEECDVLRACRGGCPKHRFTRSYYDEPGLHYLCEGYRKFFLHIRKYCYAMTQLMENGLPASRIMDLMKGPIAVRRDQRIAG